MEKLRGIIPPMITPLLGPDTIDVKSTERLVDHLIEGGVHAIFILGTTGETQSLSWKTRAEFVRLVGKAIARRIPLLVGITDTSLEDSVALAAVAKEAGAVGVVSASPYYYAGSSEDLVRYFTALADASPLPLYLYNMPSHVKVFLDVNTVRALAKHPNIVGLKDSSANMVYFTNLLHFVGGNFDPQATAQKPFALYVGPEELTAECALMGADGGVNGGANMFPKLYVDIWNAAQNHDYQAIKTLQARILDVAEAIYTIGGGPSSYLAGLKNACKQLGIIDNDYLALPYASLPKEKAAKITTALETLK